MTAWILSWGKEGSRELISAAVGVQGIAGRPSFLFDVAPYGKVRLVAGDGDSPFGRLVVQGTLLRMR